MKALAKEIEKYEKYRFDPQTDDPSSLPNVKGLYAICLKDENSLRDLSISAICPLIGEDYVIYIGVSEKQGLRNREQNNHFNGNARNSTLRKSLGSLFPWRLERITQDNGTYRFTPERERELSNWMRNNLVMLYWHGFNGNVLNIETELINELSPPLNLQKNKSPINKEFREILKRLRKK